MPRTLKFHQRHTNNAPYYTTDALHFVIFYWPYHTQTTPQVHGEEVGGGGMESTMNDGTFARSNKISLWAPQRSYISSGVLMMTVGQ